MVLRAYQKTAVNNIVEGIKARGKLRVEISVGLGRMAIIIAVARDCIANMGKKVLVLSPNISTCYQLKDQFEKEDHITECAVTFEQYSSQNLLITTYTDFQMQNQYMSFDLVLCDGIYFGDIREKFAEKKGNENACFVGFTSQVEKTVRGFFGDSECVFRYNLQNAIEDGYRIKEYEFVAIVYEIFKNVGYEVHVIQDERDAGYDLTADKEDEHLALEIKQKDIGQIGTNDLLKMISGLPCRVSEYRKPVLVTNGIVTKDQRKKVSGKESVIIVDAQNLLYMAQGDVALENELRKYLIFTTDEVSLFKPKLAMKDIASQEETQEIDALIQQFKDWDTGVKGFTEYENLCCEALEYLFKDELTLWERQRHSNEDLFRFDLICKIKGKSSENKYQKEFWEMAERFFNTKYIIFEFKNYKKSITQKEIYTTEKYLNLKALRGIAIIISVCGADNNADKAIRGILRDEGKVIISLNNSNMIKMLEKKKNNEDATSFLCKFRPTGVSLSLETV